jgi:hypothetical protein
MARKCPQHIKFHSSSQNKPLKTEGNESRPERRRRVKVKREEETSRNRLLACISYLCLLSILLQFKKYSSANCIMNTLNCIPLPTRFIIVCLQSVGLGIMNACQISSKLFQMQGKSHLEFDELTIIFSKFSPRKEGYNEMNSLVSLKVKDSTSIERYYIRKYVKFTLGKILLEHGNGNYETLIQISRQ